MSRTVDASTLLQPREEPPTAASEARAKLPAEIWSSIWLYLSLGDLVSASQACAGWRAFALADPRLWSRPDVHLVATYEYRLPPEELEARRAAQLALARPQIGMLRLCLARASSRISVSIRVDHQDPDAATICTLGDLIASRANDIAELTALFVWESALDALVRGLPRMRALRALHLRVTQGPYFSDIRDLGPLKRFPALVDFNVRPYGFSEADAGKGLGKGTDIVPEGQLMCNCATCQTGSACEDVDEHRYGRALELSDLDDDYVAPVVKGLGRGRSAFVPTARTLCMETEGIEDLVVVLRDWPRLQHLTVMLVLDKREEPSAAHLSFVRRRFRQLESLNLVCDWDVYARVRGAIPRRRRPATLQIGTHAPLSLRTYASEREVLMALEDTFDLSPVPVSLTLEPCEPPWTDTTPYRPRKPVLVRAHDAATGRTRQVDINSHMLYDNPEVSALVWPAIRSALGTSPLTSLTIPWDCVGPLITAMNADSLAVVETMVLLVTRDRESSNYTGWWPELNSTGWPALPALRHLTVKQEDEVCSLSPAKLCNAIRRLVVAPAQLQSLSLHCVHTSKLWAPVLDLADKVYGIHLA